MAGEIAYVVNALCCRFFGRGAADATAQRNSHAGRRPLKWTQHKFIAAEHVDAKPVDIRQARIQQSDEIGRICQSVCFARKQRGQLLVQKLVVDD